MSWNPALDPDCPTGDAVDAIDTVIIPRARDLGGFEVRRALPAPRRQMVGPFIFLKLLHVGDTSLGEPGAPRVDFVMASGFQVPHQFRSSPASKVHRNG